LRSDAHRVGGCHRWCGCREPRGGLGPGAVGCRAPPWKSRLAWLIRLCGADPAAGPTSRPSERQEFVVDVITAQIEAGAPLRPAADAGWKLDPSRRCVVGAIARRLFPYLVEATIIPTALFYVLLVVGDMRWALGGALTWSYGAVARRLVRHVPVPGLLVLATIGITVRTVVYALSRNDFVYFVQPIMRTTLTGLAFAASVAFGRPLVARFAADFCPLATEVRGRPGIHGLFLRLSIVWAVVNAVVAVSSLVLLLTVPVSVFVLTAAVSAWIVTCSGVVITVADSVSTAQREGLVTAVSPDGRLHATARTYLVA
jgi:hypothetical protein